MDPNNYDALILMGDLEADLDDSRAGLLRAVHCYDRAIRAKPDDYEAFWAKANLLCGADKLEQARVLVERALFLFSRSGPRDAAFVENVYTLAAEVFLKLGKLDRARRVVLQGLKLAPTDLMKTVARRIVLTESANSLASKR